MTIKVDNVKASYSAITNIIQSVDETIEDQLNNSSHSFSDTESVNNPAKLTSKQISEFKTTFDTQMNQLKAYKSITDIEMERITSPGCCDPIPRTIWLTGGCGGSSLILRLTITAIQTFIIMNSTNKIAIGAALFGMYIASECCNFTAVTYGSYKQLDLPGLSQLWSTNKIQNTGFDGYSNYLKELLEMSLLLEKIPKKEEKNTQNSDYEKEDAPLISSNEQIKPLIKSDSNIQIHEASIVHEISINMTEIEKSVKKDNLFSCIDKQISALTSTFAALPIELKTEERSANLLTFIATNLPEDHELHAAFKAVTDEALTNSEQAPPKTPPIPHTPSHHYYNAPIMNHNDSKKEWGNYEGENSTFPRQESHSSLQSESIPHPAITCKKDQLKQLEEQARKRGFQGSFNKFLYKGCTFVNPDVKSE